MDTTRKLNVLIIDDDKSVLKSVEHQLQSAFKDIYNISSFMTGEDAIENIKGDPDICIIDFYLNSDNPNAMNGVSFLQKIKNRNTEVEAVMLSGETDAEVAKCCLEHGAFDYITKGSDAPYRMKLAMKNLNNKIAYKEYNEAQSQQYKQMLKKLGIGIAAIVAISAMIIYLTQS
jgi:DNA-binding NtrC family response regulator